MIWSVPMVGEGIKSMFKKNWHKSHYDTINGYG